MPTQYTSELTPAERRRRQRYFAATVITCIAIAMVFGTVHVVQLGANRMADMKARATYDIAEMPSRIRAAGEEITRHEKHETQKQADETYALNEIQAFLSTPQWQELDIVITIPAGEFQMGSDSARTNPENRPAHRVNLAAYQIDKYPVTQAEYARFVAASQRRPPLDWERGVIPDQKYLHPVTMVTWYDAQAYCAWEGKRLPTEMEWEKAARGTDGRRWPWGEQMDPARLNTYYHVGATTEVTTYASGVSPYGVFDMAGNVSEWTASEFVAYAGSDAPADIFKPKKIVAGSAADRTMKVGDLVNVEGTYKVRRGGSWKSDPFATAVYHRDSSLPYYASDFFGFRCVKDAQASNQ